MMCCEVSRRSVVVDTPICKVLFTLHALSVGSIQIPVVSEGSDQRSSVRMLLLLLLESLQPEELFFRSKGSGDPSRRRAESRAVIRIVVLTTAAAAMWIVELTGSLHEDAVRNSSIQTPDAIVPFDFQFMFRRNDLCPVVWHERARPVRKTTERGCIGRHQFPSLNLSWWLLIVEY
jgi:hypothetical protein